MFTNLLLASMFTLFALGAVLSFDRLFRAGWSAVVRLANLAARAQLLLSYLSRAYGRYQKSLNKNLIQTL